MSYRAHRIFRHFHKTNVYYIDSLQIVNKRCIISELVYFAILVTPDVR